MQLNCSLNSTAANKEGVSDQISKVVMTRVGKGKVVAEHITAEQGMMF